LQEETTAQVLHQGSCDKIIN